MKWAEIKDKSADELTQLLSEKRAELVDLRFKVASGALKQVHQIARSRKLIARLTTKLSQIKNSKA